VAAKERNQMDAAWIVVNIGCIECGVSSGIVGVFTDKAQADAIAESLDGSHSWRDGGQNEFEVFPMPPLNEIAAEYAEGSGNAR
jgi:hypothetical protein